MKNELHKNREVDKGDELLARILNAAACIKKREDQLRRTTRDLHTGVTKWTQVDSVIFERLPGTLASSSYLCNKFVIKH